MQFRSRNKDMRAIDLELHKAVSDQRTTAHTNPASDLDTNFVHAITAFCTGCDGILSTAAGA